jgi:hypothetical protein
MNQVMAGHALPCYDVRLIFSFVISVKELSQHPDTSQDMEPPASFDPQITK